MFILCWGTNFLFPALILGPDTPCPYNGLRGSLSPLSTILLKLTARIKRSEKDKLNSAQAILGQWGKTLAELQVDHWGNRGFQRPTQAVFLLG